MDERLKELKEYRKRYGSLIEKREMSYGLWSLWKYLAQDEEWFDNFIHDERIPWPELKYVKAGSGDGVDVSYEHGVRLWKERRQILNEVELCERHILNLMRDMYVNDDRSKNIDLADIAEAYGATVGGALHYMVRNGIPNRREKYGEVEQNV